MDGDVAVGDALGWKYCLRFPRVIARDDLDLLFLQTVSPL